ncbi:PQQ-binding-like beta-propeller repeat protein [uncultured Imperialibacter sp.]|uniref:outer membrane protein assembly factor BamB family protein n=1 Tax=uncultured Imperialibacter sp. TaxID=1672639 RepID=UPI0030DDCE8D|tara:strand:- start:172722 stop:174197 length:1476 start_codon:yes stop_codon:yes gene_type:complete
MAFRFTLFMLVCISIAGQLLAQDSWTKRLPGIGTFSSPRVADLNGDGIKDIILGAGREEFKACDSAVFALDGRTGDMLWNVSAIDQVFGSASLKDITGDGVMDVFINGRSAELQAVNGKTGEVIWHFNDPDLAKERKQKQWFNFYNPQFVPDQNGDGVEDILISNGGDVMAEPYDPNRPAGHLVVLNTLTGEVLGKAKMPDGKEIYMSVATLPIAGSQDREIIFGTGGETIGGNLWLGTLSQVMKGDLTAAIKLDSSANKGFIAPAAWVDVNDDGRPDIVANAVDGRFLAFDGKTHQKIWQVQMDNTEAYSSVSVGYFNADKAPDFFLSFAQGSWPNLDWTKQFMVNGANGGVEFLDSLGLYQTTTPVIADFTLDGVDDALVIVNYQAESLENGLMKKYFYNMLAVIDFTTGEVIDLDVHTDGHNLSSTPWVGDLDGDGNIDIVYCHSTNTEHTYTFDGMEVVRLTTTLPVNKEIKWGAYMGSGYDSVFKK